MLQIKVFGPTPPCANCKRAEREARKAAEAFGEQVEVIKLDIMGEEAEQYGILTSPLIVVGDEVAGRGAVVPAAKLKAVIQKHLGA